MLRSLPLVVVVSSALALSMSCSRTTASPSEADAASSSATQPSVQTLNITHDATTVGAEVRATASGLPAGKTVELTWKTVSGGWVIEDYYHFKGKKYEESTLSLGRFPVDSSGRLDARFTIPEDYGGVHDVIALIDGERFAQGGIEVTQSFEMTPASGPVGTPIELTVKDGRVTDIAGGPEARILRDYLDVYGDENAYMCPAEASVGVNAKAVVRGIQREDKNIMGTLHFGLGTNVDVGGSIKSKIHMDGVILHPTLYVDGVKRIDNGKILVEIEKE